MSKQHHRSQVLGTCRRVEHGPASGIAPAARTSLVDATYAWLDRTTTAAAPSRPTAPDVLSPRRAMVGRSRSSADAVPVVGAWSSATVIAMLSCCTPVDGWSRSEPRDGGCGSVSAGGPVHTHHKVAPAEPFARAPGWRGRDPDLVIPATRRRSDAAQYSGGDACW